MKTGTLKWFNPHKGYGFIKPVDGGFDVYVHGSAIELAGIVDPKEGQKINFEIVVDQRTGEVRAENLSACPEFDDSSERGAEAARAPNAPPFAGFFPAWRAARVAGPRRV